MARLTWTSDGRIASCRVMLWICRLRYRPTNAVPCVARRLVFGLTSELPGMFSTLFFTLADRRQVNLALQTIEDASRKIKRNSSARPPPNKHSMLLHPPSPTFSLRQPSKISSSTSSAKSSPTFRSFLYGVQRQLRSGISLNSTLNSLSLSRSLVLSCLLWLRMSSSDRLRGQLGGGIWLLRNRLRLCRLVNLFQGPTRHGEGIR